MSKIDDIDRRWLLTNASLGAVDIERYVTVSDDGSINVFRDVFLGYAVEHIPLQFGQIDGSFSCSNVLKVIKGCPRKVTKTFTCSSMFVKDFENLPSAPKLNLVGTPIKSLNEILPHLRGNVIHLDVSGCAGLKSLVGIDEIKVPKLQCLSSITFSQAYVEHGGLGLLTLPGIMAINAGLAHAADSKGKRTGFPTNETFNPYVPSTRADAFRIIIEAVKSGDIFGAQQLLIEEDLERFARL